MAAVLEGPHTWSGGTDDAGFRTYKLVQRVRQLSTEGPAVALNCPGLFLPGAAWAVDGDADPWVWCRPEREAVPEIEGEKGQYWFVTSTFSNRPPDRNAQRCNDAPIEDPLLEPPKISGSFIKSKEEVDYDRFGIAVVNSSWEKVRGPSVEFEADGGVNLRIEQNVASFTDAVSLPAQLMNRVNSVSLWGLAPRMIRLANWTFERKYYGLCSVYYNRVLEFEINYQTFDRTLLDEGSKVLRGSWHPTAPGVWQLRPVGLDCDGAEIWPNPDNPAHFDRYKDSRDENTRVVLDGRGMPATEREVTYCFEGTPVEAIREARSVGGSISGPYATEADCQSNCGGAGTGSGTAAVEDWWCLDGTDCFFGTLLEAVRESATGEVQGPIGSQADCLLTCGSILGGSATAWWLITVPERPPGEKTLQRYLQVDLTLLGIPTSF